MKQKIIGTFELGYENVQLVLREGDGAEFYFLPKDIRHPRIKIGADYKEWHYVLTSLFHEVFEFSFTRKGLRYNATEMLERDHSAYRFFVPHEQFTDCCAQAADFISSCHDPLKKEWEKWNKAKK